ncbi:hypothetical protein [Pontibacter mangrovi]|uniref:Lipid/polyisoprenoid-binding YceI-like domain-containing protein n=1 Tax=Pontibacter mangrovi TaxID=2589816 RepID=A0A501VYY5_9BACT|nr:hypothetical protein [Pontibacter mangrovi]TPE42953.1 hypothetical protein FJM65_14985 [Pontibacter mangrovi]
MNKLRFAIIWCLLLGILVSCGDKEEDPSPTTAELDYQPYSKGSTWTYGGDKPYTITATGNTKEIEGKTFSEFETKQDSETWKSYFLKEKDVYTAVGMHPTMGNIAIDFLKVETPEGKPWYQTNTINGIETKMTFTIIAKGLSKTVEGKTYQDVIHVQMNSTYIFMGEEVELDLPTDYFWAKGVGLILTDAGPLGKMPLTTYNIK